MPSAFSQEIQRGLGVSLEVGVTQGATLRRYQCKQTTAGSGETN